MKVLVIDDEPTVRMLLVDILEPLQWEVIEANDCLEGLHQLKANKDFDLALVDWRTPKMSGLELVQEVRKDPGLSHVRLMMITGLNDLDDVKLALEAGADEFLMKPFVSEMLFDKLRLLGFDVKS